MRKNKRIYEKYGLNANTATESDLYDARMQQLSNELGIDLEQASSAELDEARLEVRERSKCVRSMLSQ